MRYVLNFNPEGSATLSEGYNGSIEFKKLPKGLKSGAVTAVRFADSGNGVAPLTPRDEVGNRLGTVINEKIAREVGLKGRKRYMLKQVGRSNWYNLIPHSNIGKKARRIDGPGVSVSIIER